MMRFLRNLFGCSRREAAHDGELRRGNQLTNFLRHVKRLLVCGLRKNDQELFAPPTPDGIRCTDAVLQKRRYANEDRITDRMTKLIIDPLEIIDVEHHQT